MKNHSTEYINSVKNNFRFIASVVKPSAQLKSEDQDLAQIVSEFIDVISSDSNEKQRVVFVYLALLLRYPFPHELNATLFDIKFDGVPQALFNIFKNNRGAIGELTYLPSDKLLLDVSHTKKYKHNSGIQRVVRSLCKSLWSKQKNIQFIHWNESLQPMVVDEDEIDFVVSWTSSSKGKKGALTTKRWKLRLAFVSTILKRLVLLPFKCVMPSIHFVLRYLLNNTNVGITVISKLDSLKSKNSSILGLVPIDALEGDYKRPRDKVLLFYKSNLLVPELTCEGYRYEPTFVIRDSELIKLGYILYDLIPVFNPEFCVSTIRSEFNQYLKLLRYADKISCISETVKDEIISLEKCVNRLVPNKLEKKTHLLAGDFSQEIATDQSMGKCIPQDGLEYILAVGTLEPRKNGLAVLRAAISAMKKGHKFRLIFAGNPGWLAEELLENIHRYQKQGFPISAFSSVSEGSLKYLYQNCKFTMFCSLAEGFGLPILESLAYQKPVITSNRGSMKELAEKFGGCLLVDPANVDDICDKISTLLTDSKLYENLKSNAKDIPKPSWDDYSEEIYSFFRP